MPTVLTVHAAHKNVANGLEERPLKKLRQRRDRRQLAASTVLQNMSSLQF